MKTKVKPGSLKLTETATLVDPEGLYADDCLLADLTWEVREDASDHVTYERAGGILLMRLSVAEENSFRLSWELSVHSAQTQLAYAKRVVRPGDMTAAVINDLITEAVTAGEAELNKLREALEDAKRVILQQAPKAAG